MKFQITTPASAPAVDPDAYVVEVETMRGDGDGFETIKVGPFYRGQHEENLQSLLETLERMNEAFPRGVAVRGSYRDVLGFEQWFGEAWDMATVEEFFPKLLELYGREVQEKLVELAEPVVEDMSWPYEEGRANRLTGFHVYYYNADGEKFNVEYSSEDV